MDNQPILSLLYYVFRSAHKIERDHRHATRHRLNHNHRESFIIRAHHKQRARSILFPYIPRGRIDAKALLQAFLINHPLQHPLPFALPVYVERPILIFTAFLHKLPCTYQPVESLLIIQTSHRQNTMFHNVRATISKAHSCIRNHLHIRQITPIASILICQHHKTVKPADNLLVLVRTPSVDHSQQSLPSILDTEEFAIMQFKHFLAAIVD